MIYILYIYFFLFNLDKPQPPTNLSFVDISFNKAILSWIPGSDGGDAQSFSVNVLNEEGAIINTFKVDGETQKDTTIYLTLTQLHPDTSYGVEVVATNSFGTSKTSLILMTVGKLFLNNLIVLLNCVVT